MKVCSNCLSEVDYFADEDSEMCEACLQGDD
jgi:RNA polymerase subunit RPABC4/transcription elongation factor Spt4